MSLDIISIAEPQEGAEIVAKETRERLQGMAAGLGKLTEDEITIGVYDAAASQAFRKQVAAALDIDMQGLNALQALYLVVSTTVGLGRVEAHHDYSAYHLTLAMEAGAGMIRKLMHIRQGDWDLPPQEELGPLIAAPYATSWGTDEKADRIRTNSQYSEAYRRVRDGMPEGMKKYMPHAPVPYASVYTPPYLRPLGDYHVRDPWKGAVLVQYAWEGTAWVAGFLSYEDLTRGKFCRMSLGAYLHGRGMNDAEVQFEVEIAKRKYVKTTWVAYPNDVCFADVYVNKCRVSSCMSHGEGHYSSPVHPVTVYSTALHTEHDNGLALFVSSCQTARAIVNTDTMQYVRFYGPNKLCRALEGIGIDAEESALDGVHLAAIEAKSGLVAPYLDGYPCHINWEGGPLMQVGCRGHEADNTNGLLFVGELHECEYSGDEYPEDEVSWCDGGEYYVADKFWGDYVARDYVTNLDYLIAHMEEVQVDGYTRYVYDTASLFDEDYWIDGNGDYWSDNINRVEVDGEFYREDDCTYNEETKEWELD